MPKRTNLFQRLVKLLHQKLDSNWVVCESEMLVHRLTNEEREVDIVLRYRLGQHDFLLSIECTDTSRPASSTWVEAMAKKHEFLPTSKLVLWSASGFYKPAIATAKMLGIDVVSQDKDEEKEWSKFKNIFNRGFVKLVSPEYSHFIDYVDADGNKSRLDGSNNYLLKGAGNEVCFSILELKQLVSNNSKLGSTLLDHATDNKNDFWVQFVPPFDCLVQKEDGAWVEVFRIGFGIKANTENTRLESKSISYEDGVSTLAAGATKNGVFEIFVQEKNDQPPVVSAWINKKANK